MISYWQIFKVFAKIGAFTIGGGIPMIAAIKTELVERKWLTDEDFIDIITLAQTAWNKGKRGGNDCKLPSAVPYHIDGSNVLHCVQGK